MQSLELIDRFLKHELSPEEARQFEQMIIADPAFAEEVSFYIAASKLAKEESQEEKIRRFRQLQREVQPPTGKLIRMSNFRRLAVAAAVIAAIAIGFYLFQSPAKPNQLADDYITNNFSVLGVTMSNNTDSLQEGLKWYNEGKFPEALNRFQLLMQSDSSAVTALKYAGIVTLRTGQYDLALQYFTRLENYPGLYANPGKFYHALTLMKRNQPGDKQNAKLLLQEVVQKDLEGKEAAQEWLGKM